MGWSMTGRASVDNGFPLRPVMWHPWPVAGGRRRALRGRVLVVDDDPSLGEMLGIVLRQEGFEPVFVRSGDQAIAAFHQAKPDLVLLDLMLPGKDGLEICRELRMESGVPIVMLTAKTDTVDIVLGLESGADDYITKPFSAKELVARIRARLRRRDTDGAETLRFHDIENPRVVQTVRGVGYRIGPEVGAEDPGLASDAGT